MQRVWSIAMHSIPNTVLSHTHTHKHMHTHTHVHSHKINASVCLTASIKIQGASHDQTRLICLQPGNTNCTKKVKVSHWSESSSYFFTNGERQNDKRPRWMREAGGARTTQRWWGERQSRSEEAGEGGEAGKARGSEAPCGPPDSDKPLEARGLGGTHR